MWHLTRAGVAYQIWMRHLKTGPPPGNESPPGGEQDFGLAIQVMGPLRFVPAPRDTRNGFEQDRKVRFGTGEAIRRGHFFSGLTALIPRLINATLSTPARHRRRPSFPPSQIDRRRC